MPHFNTKYNIVDKIGEGSFSEVLKCENRETKEQFAAKVLKKSFKRASDALYCAEIVAMQKLKRHPNILYMYEYFHEKSTGKVIFIFELMDMSMYDFITAKKRRIPEVKVKNYLYQLLNGLDYLHRRGLFHRDIKPENILIKTNVSTETSLLYNSLELVKLADLGSIRGIYSKAPYTEYISTRWYRSPECLLTVGHYGPKMDIWATGCVFFEMFTLKPIFAGTNEIDQLAKIHNVLGTPSQRLLGKLKSRSKNLQNFSKQIGIGLTSLTKALSEDGQHIIKLMLQYDPDIRSNAGRLLQHRYFSDYKERERIRRVKPFVSEYGDTLTQPTIVPKKFQSTSTKSLLVNNLRKPSNFSSKTDVQLGSCCMGSKIKTNGHILTKRTAKTLKQADQESKLNVLRSRIQLSLSRANEFRNTANDLLKTFSLLDNIKSSSLQSNSFISTNKIVPALDGRLNAIVAKYSKI